MASPASTFVPTYDVCDRADVYCPVQYTLYGYTPRLGVNLFFTFFFGLMAVSQFTMGLVTRSWSFMTWIVIGLIFETAGYIGRTFMFANPWNQNAVQTQLICLIIAPSIIAGAIAVTFQHLIIYVGEEHSKLKAKCYSKAFIITDVLSILIQVVGAGVAAGATGDSANKETYLHAGTVLLVTGVSLQAANMVISGCLLLKYMWNYRKAKMNPEERTGPESQYAMDRSDPKQRRNLRLFIWSLAIAFVAILIRCIYRIPEMAGGWGGTIMQQEIPFIVLETAMMAIAALSLTIIHPGKYPKILKNQVESQEQKNLGSVSTA